MNCRQFCRQEVQGSRGSLDYVQWFARSVVPEVVDDLSIVNVGVGVGVSGIHFLTGLATELNERVPDRFGAEPAARLVAAEPDSGSARLACQQSLGWDRRDSSAWAQWARDAEGREGTEIAERDAAGLGCTRLRPEPDCRRAGMQVEIDREERVAQGSIGYFLWLGTLWFAEEMRNAFGGKTESGELYSAHGGFIVYTGTLIYAPHCTCLTCLTCLGGGTPGV